MLHENGFGSPAKNGFHMGGGVVFHVAVGRIRERDEVVDHMEDVVGDHGVGVFVDGQARGGMGHV